MTSKPILWKILERILLLKEKGEHIYEAMGAGVENGPKQKISGSGMKKYQIPYTEQNNRN